MPRTLTLVWVGGIRHPAGLAPSAPPGPAVRAG
jgi:hypothetical protein